jgi:predicted ATPase/DNA-binding CsgD family transcriptional regulator
MQQATATPHNLPVQFTTLIGREQEIAAVCTLLRRPEVRLLTLTGTGGIGKTRLATQVAFEILQDFPDGVFFVPLAPINDPDLVAPTIAETLGLREAGDWPLLERLKTYLRERHILLLFDNFEQILPAASLLSELLAMAPDLKLLVTSRAVLHLRGEHEFSVAPLALPDLKRPEAREALVQSPAVALFVGRAQALKPDFQLTDANAQTIAEICARLDGLPLAIELAAARIKLLPPPALLTRLEHRLQVLTSTTRDVPARQQTLRSALDWSYDLLSQEEQHLFRRLSVFVDGCTLEAAEAVINDTEGALPMLDGLAALIDKSLLQQAEGADQEPRFVMLETIREYARELLLASGEAAEAQRAHAAYYLALAEEAEPKLTGAEQRRWLERLAAEHENLRAALLWFAEQGDTERALRLGGALWWFWWIRGYVSEGRNFLQQAQSAGEEVAAAVRAKALNAAGTLAVMQGNFDETEALCSASLALFRAAGENQRSVAPLWMLGYVSMEQSEYERARQLTEEALTLARQYGNTWGIAYSLENLAAIAFNQGDYRRAHTFIEESLATSRKTGDTEGVARSSWLLALLIMAQGDLAKARTLLEGSLALSSEVGDKRNNAYSRVILGYVAIFQDLPAQARTLLEDGLALLREMGDRRGIAWALYGLGWEALSQGNAAAAQPLFEESLALLRELGHRWFMALCLEALAAAFAAQGQPERAARLWGAAEKLRDMVGASLPPVVQPMYESFLIAARAQAGETAFASAWAEGRIQSLETLLDAQEPMQAVPAGSQRRPLSGSASEKSPAGLTARELEVLRWVAMGLTDAQVAEKLVISPRTVSTHLTSIYNKLGVTTRSAATRFAVEHHLV